MTRGILTIAYGSDYYVRMGKCMAMSIRLRNPEEVIAVVTDRDPDEFQDLFDVVIPLKIAHGEGVVQKLHVFSYSPFDETLFIDSDCLVFADSRKIWDAYQGCNDFGIYGYTYYGEKDEHMSVRNMKKYLNAYEVKRIPIFNSGVFYFKKSSLTEHIYKTCKKVYNDRERLGLVGFKNAPINDEPVFSMALALNGVDILPWENGFVMSTWLGLIEQGKSINVLKGRSRYTKNGVKVNPMIIHFNVNCQSCFVYRREMNRLSINKWWWKWGGPTFMTLIEMLPYYGKRLLEKTRIREND